MLALKFLLGVSWLSVLTLKYMSVMFFLYILWMLGRLISGYVSFAAIIPSFESHDHMSTEPSLGLILVGFDTRDPISR